MKQPIRLIATDLDGTLVHSDGSISEANRVALQAIRDAGIHLVVCTGRRHSYAMRVLRDGVLQADEIIVSSNGVVTRNFAGELFWRHTLPHELVRRMCAVLNDYRDSLVLTFDHSTPDGGDAPGALAVEQLDSLHGSIRRWMEVNAASLQQYVRIEDALLNGNGPEPIQAMLCGGLERTRGAERLLQEQLGTSVQTFRTEYPGKNLCILDIVPKSASKGLTLCRVAEHFGVAMQQVLAVGDNWNDVPMLEVAGRSIVLGNAPRDLLCVAEARHWHIGEAVDRDGFAHAVRALIEGEADRT